MAARPHCTHPISFPELKRIESKFDVLGRSEAQYAEYLVYTQLIATELASTVDSIHAHPVEEITDSEITEPLLLFDILK
jgi:hypothetical protein